MLKIGLFAQKMAELGYESAQLLELLRTFVAIIWSRLPKFLGMQKKNQIEHPGSDIRGGGDWDNLPTA